MEKNKVRFLQEKEIECEAQKNASFFENAGVDNPIEKKFLAFSKTRKNSRKNQLKDLF